MNEESDADSFIRSDDSTLYEAKDAGKNYYRANWQSKQIDYHMRKGTYYLIQAIVSLILTSAIWYLTVDYLEIAMNDIDAYGIVVTDATISPFLVFVLSMGFYFILTIIYIIIGAKTVKGWKPSVIIGSIVIFILMFALGLFVPGVIAAVNGELSSLPDKIQDLLTF